jgi:Uma2 family endonuclease
MTADEFYDWVLRPENQDRHFELVRGDVVEVPLPGERQALICANVTALLNSYARQRRRGRVLSNDPGILLEKDPDTVRGPDVAFFDDVRSYDQLNPKWLEGAPMLAVEVLSPNDRIGKVTRRIAEFLRAGTHLVWLIDPEARDVTAHRPGQNPQVFEAGQELTGEDVLPDFRCPVAEFFFVAGEAAPPPPASRPSAPGAGRRRRGSRG